LSDLAAAGERIIGRLNRWPPIARSLAVRLELGWER
jgi:hypothetical protein